MRRTPRGLPRTAFKSDGCTMFPDGAYRSCCVEHDRAYWRGGTMGHRLAADRELAFCVWRLRGPVLAVVMYAAVRVGGAFFWPHRRRWGYGHRWPLWK